MCYKKKTVHYGTYGRLDLDGLLSTSVWDSGAWLWYGKCSSKSIACGVWQQKRHNTGWQNCKLRYSLSEHHRQSSLRTAIIMLSVPFIGGSYARIKLVCLWSNGIREDQQTRKIYVQSSCCSLELCQCQSLASLLRMYLGLCWQLKWVRWSDWLIFVSSHFLDESQS